MKVSTLVLVLFSTAFIANCSKQDGGNSEPQTLVAQARVAHSINQGLHRLKLSSVVNAVIPFFEELIQSPNGQMNLGSVVVEPLNNGQSKINLDLDLSTLITNPPEALSLNVEGVDVSNVIGLPVGNSGSSVFFSAVHDLLGISMFVNKMSSTSGAINTLLPLVLNTAQNGNSLSGFTGIFKGEQNVISIFADIAPILNQILSAPPPPQEPKIVSGLTDVVGVVAGGYVGIHTGSPFLGTLANGLVHQMVNGVVRVVDHL